MPALGPLALACLLQGYFFLSPILFGGLPFKKSEVAKPFSFSIFGFFASRLPRFLLPFDIYFPFKIRYLARYLSMRAQAVGFAGLLHGPLESRLDFWATIASVVISRPATDAAFSNAIRITLVGSMMPAVSMST